MEVDGAQGAELGTDTGKQEQAMEEGRFSFFKSSRFMLVSLTLSRTQILALSKDGCVKFT